MIFRLKALRCLPMVLLAFSISSCSGVKTSTCTTNCTGGGGTADISFTLVADTPPASPTILSFPVTITGITVTSATSTKSLTPDAAPIDLMRLQSDSAVLGTIFSVPSETISSFSVALSSPSLTFLNNTGVALTSPPCAINAVCTFNPSAVGADLINVNQVFASNTGYGIDFNLTNAISVTGTTLNVNFNPPTNNFLTAFTLPRTGSNLAAGQLDLIEDVTGVVGLNGQNATISNPLTLATLTAAATASTNFDADPTGTLCPTSTKQTLSTCVASGQLATMDVILNSDGTLSIQEIEPLAATQQDFVEGVVVGITAGSSTQFTLVVTDILPAATGSLVGTGLLHVGDGLTVNIPAAQPFRVDTKGLNLSSFSSNVGNFQNQTNTTAIHPGQTVAIHVTAFTPVSGTTIASATADTVTLRWSRFTASVMTPTTPTFTVTTFPANFNVAGGTSLVVQTFTGTTGGDGVTNLDGITSTANLSTTKTVSIRGLFIENAADNLAQAFYAAKVRQH